MEPNMKLLLVLVLFATLFSSQAAGDLISTVCAKTEYPDFCESTLRSTTGAPTADLKRLAQMMLEKAIREASDSLATVTKLLQAPNISQARRNALGFCRLAFAGAVAQDAEAVKDFDRGLYAKAAPEVGNGADIGSVCNSKFNVPEAGPSPLPDGGLNHGQLARVAEQLINQIS